MFPAVAPGKVITSDTVWSGEVSADEDILIPEGVTVTVSPGTIIRITPSDSTKTDPEYLSPLTEITVRGTLTSDGREGAPVTFLVKDGMKSSWAGIIVDGGKVNLRTTIVRDAETGIYAIKGSVSTNGSLLTKNHYGLAVEGRDAAVLLESTKVRENDYGVVLLRGATIDGRDYVVKDNEKKDRLSPEMKRYASPEMNYKAPKKEISRTIGDSAVLGEAVWQGRVVVDGIIRVPEGSRLIILPGTIVEFTKKDTNHDGIGENGLLIQGVIIAKGTKEHPIFFRSAEKKRRMGDWDAINILNSDRAQNLVEYCQIEDGYRGLHIHFANVAVTDSVVRNNYRGVQFQESIVSIKGTFFYGNKSGLQARDSDIVFRDNVVSDNYSGMNLFRNTLTLRGSVIMNNYRDGLRVREGLPVVKGNLLAGNRYGLMVVDAVYGSFAGNVISHNLESGVSLKGADNVEVSGNVIQSNGMDGIHILDSGGVIRDNLISDNAERGIGILTFEGLITSNNILGNGIYNLGVEGIEDVAAQMNWWGGGDVRKTISDRETDPSKGAAALLPVQKWPVRVAWPLEKVTTDAIWRGEVLVEKDIAVSPGIDLVIYPGTRVLFSKGTGMQVKGRIIARGEKNARIAFAAATGKNAGEWSEILMDHAVGSVFSYCAFENASWALHSHFTDLRVEDCSFVDNNGGIRFTSGPIEVRRSYFGGNDVGIRAFRGTALITENVITGNRIGIFVREKGGGLAIRRNNLFANIDYNIRMGDFNTEDVDAKDNWWGDLSPADTVYDSRREPGIGRVICDPHADRPFPYLTAAYSSSLQKMQGNTGSEEK
ncbi:MAG: right-handed parallel beta-helix repeat-containing protein [Acidobacteriota bacterium]